MASLAQASHGSNVFAEHHPSGSTPAPSAPPLYPEVQHPSAPPLSAEWQMVVSTLTLAPSVLLGLQESALTEESSQLAGREALTKHKLGDLNSNQDVAKSPSGVQKYICV